jgi:hypothetical protein
MFKAEVWCHKSLNFVENKADILEQAHFDKKFKNFTDYEMFIDLELKPDEVSFIKVKSTLLE